MWVILQRFRNEHGEKRVVLLKRQHVEAILAGKPPYPRRNWLRALRHLLQFAETIGMITERPNKGCQGQVAEGRWVSHLGRG